MEADRVFGADERAAVEAAVREVEARSAGEIVPYVVDRSDAYPNASWKGAAMGALLGPLVAILIFRLGGFWWTHVYLWMAVPALAGAAAGFLLSELLPSLRRQLAGPESLALRVHRRAAAAFLEREVFRTVERTGILIFVSLFERRVVVLADSGIQAKVSQAEWDAIAARLAEQLRRGQGGTGLAAAVRECGELLERQGVARRPDDTNELSDTLQRRRE
jgi:putative membrane protein